MPRFPLAQVLSSNATLSDTRDVRFGPGLAGLFVGGTSGIGETTLKAFARHAVSPRIYVVGRNQNAYDRIVSEVQTINSGAKLNFLPADCSELKEVDRVCNEVIRMEEEILGKGKAQLNFLVLTVGFMSLKGRNESPEGLDRKMACNYYSRLRFVDRLQPLLNAASAVNKPSRVLSVLAGGHEGPLDLNDLDLKNTFTLGKCLTHSATMTTFAFEELAKENPGTTYVHTAPGFVKTQFLRPLESWWTKPVIGALMILIKPWETNFEESGERHLHMGLSGTGSWVPMGEKENDTVAVAVGSDGTRGSGAYALGSEGQSVGNGNVMKKMRQDGVGKKVMEHLRSVFERIENENS